MKNKLIALLLIIGISACASPVAKMSPDQVVQLSDDQLCNMRSNYLYDQNTELEVGRRNLNCDPAYRECSNRGYAPKTAEHDLCVNETRQKWAMQSALQNQQAIIKRMQNAEYYRSLSTRNQTRVPQQVIVNYPQ